ncbi:MAG: hypothetical protein ABJX82_10140, partial [Paracoccaceae bacterium]
QEVARTRIQFGLPFVHITDYGMSIVLQGKNKMLATLNVKERYCRTDNRPVLELVEFPYYCCVRLFEVIRHWFAHTDNSLLIMDLPTLTPFQTLYFFQQHQRSSQSLSVTFTMIPTDIKP